MKNQFEVEIKKEGNKIIKTETWTLEEGKTTLRGPYPKFKEEYCPFPERLDCNSGVGYSRCKFMEFISLGNWRCNHKNDVK